VAKVVFIQWHKMKKRIGIEVQRLFRPKKHGMEVVALELIKELQQVDTPHEFVVFVKKDSDPCVFPSMNMEIKELRSWPYPVWEQVAFPMAAKEMKLDVLHSTCNTSALFSPVPLVLTLHDIIYLEKLAMTGTMYQNFGNIYRRFVVPMVVKKAKVIVTVSEFEKKVMADKLGIPDQKIRVVYNAVGKQFNKQYTSERIESFRISNKLPSNFILFLGNTAPKKNTKNTILAYVNYASSEGSPLPLVVLDYAKDLLLNYLKELGAERLIDHIIFPGYIKAEEMPLMYNAASLFLYPSIRESFGLPILEAMACGVPVITSNTSAMPEVAGGAAWLVDPFDVSDIASAITYLLANGEKRNDLIQKGLERSEFFNWKQAATQLVAIYEKV